jgi:hypothetical protein
MKKGFYLVALMLSLITSGPGQASNEGGRTSGGADWNDLSNCVITAINYQHSISVACNRPLEFEYCILDQLNEESTPSTSTSPPSGEQINDAILSCE